MGIVGRLGDSIDRYGLIKIFLPVYLFFQPFSKFSGVRNTAFFLVLFFFIVKAAARKARFDFKDGAFIAFFALAGACLLSSVAGPYPAESLGFIRKNLFYQAVAFVVILSEYKDMKDLKPLLYGLMAGFAALSLLIVCSNGVSVLIDWLSHENKRFTQGYSLFATFYLPLAAAYLYASKDGLKAKGLISFFIVFGIILSVLNNHRTQIVAIAASLVLVSLLAKKYRLLLAGLAFSVVAGILMLQMNPKSIDRYKTLLSADTYLTNDYTALNNRLAIWSGTLEMIKERPVLGYGYGWKKISTAAKDGFMERWKDREEKKQTYDYFNEKGYGRANPHNLALQILFETGALGLTAFLAFWAMIALKAFKAALGGKKDEGERFIVYSVTGVLLSYAVVNVTNGLWEEAFGVLMMSYAACVTVIYRQAREAKEE